MKKILFIFTLVFSFGCFGQTKEHIIYYESGAVRIKSNYVEEELQGELIAYFENGVIQARAYFVEGKLQGKRIFYTLNGEIKKIENYKDGMLINNK